MLRAVGRTIISLGRKPTPAFFTRNSNLQQRLRYRVKLPRTPPKDQYGSSVKGKATLKAVVGTGTILLAATRPLEVSMPERYHAAWLKEWKEASEKGDVTRARILFLAETLSWLQHYFHGTVTDDGPFESDMVILPGMNLLRPDARPFFVPVPEGKRADMPIACVAVNHFFFAKGPDEWDDDEDEYKYRCMMARELDIMPHLKLRLLQWRERELKQKTGFGGNSNSDHQGA